MIGKWWRRIARHPAGKPHRAERVSLTAARSECRARAWVAESASAARASPVGTEITKKLEKNLRFQCSLAATEGGDSAARRSSTTSS